MVGKERSICPTFNIIISIVRTTLSQGSACHKPLLSRAAFLGTAVSKPHACCCLPHELSVISTPPCLPRPRIKARTCGGLGALLFSRQPSRAPRKLEQEQVRPGFDCGIYGGGESRQRGAGVQPSRSQNQTVVSDGAPSNQRAGHAR